ncbi:MULTISPECIES: hypothetical protein [unclassified Aureispira]|uniref:hypothetical protein n=1 Tax=unclassified Aureispira TaxID=2649989 RepID=UPI000698FC93|nr:MULTISPECIES: hypothetical protein [unclassified Aureispira]WMX12794.1 hypothetical protein QP953_18325 [Aureispira sp. CCB-E]
MTSFRIRPRFRFTTKSSPAQIKREMEEKLKTSHESFTFKSVKGHFIVRIKGGEKHYWSPHLHIEFEQLSDGKTLIRGLYGPNPNIWTLFALSYGAILLSILFVGIYEGCQYNLGIITSFSWAIPILFGTGILMYLISQLGQKLGAEQTFALHHFLEDALHQHIDIQ